MNTYLQYLQEKTAQDLYQREGITYLGLFGSAARGEETSKSDIDLLIHFDAIKSFFELADIQYDLENMLGRKVDLVFKDSIKAQLKPFIEQDLITVYEKN